MEIKVEIRRGLADQYLVAHGVLTDEHPTSSYGLPVVVIDGTPYGSAELGDSTLRLIDPPEHEANIQAGNMDAVVAYCQEREDAERAAIRAGYHLAYGLPQ